MSRIGCLLLVALLLPGCASAPEGRVSMGAPGPLQGLSAVYSEFDMRLQLVTATNADACRAAECVADRAFDQRILTLGKRLAEVAYRQYPQLLERFPHFEFVIADKADAGSASSAWGTVVVFRGVRYLNLDDAALTFVLAREISHVIAGHHDENVATSIAVGVAAQILMPWLAIARGAAAAVGSGAATAATASGLSATVTTTAINSVASFAGSKVLRASYRPGQMREAEVLSVRLLNAVNVDARELGEQISVLPPALLGDVDWVKDLRESGSRLATLLQGPVQPPDELAKLGSDRP